jgi:hypothetical protein
MHLANTKDINSLSGAHLRCLPAFPDKKKCSLFEIVLNTFSCETSSDSDSKPILQRRHCSPENPLYRMHHVVANGIASNVSLGAQTRRLYKKGMQPGEVFVHTQQENYHFMHA